MLKYIVLLLAPFSLLGQQENLAEKISAKVQLSEVWKDNSVNVTGLILINHKSLNKKYAAKPGISDRDLKYLVKFPKLTAFNIERMPVTDEGLNTLKEFPGMKQLGFHYMLKKYSSPDFIRLMDNMNDLEILEIKHNFDMKKISLDQVEGNFSKIWRLVLDTPIKASETLVFAAKAPNVTDLQLHRTDMTPDQLKQLAKLMPNLEVLWFKPKGGLLAGHLEALKEFKKLRIFSPQHFKNKVPFEGGWEHLAKIPSLQRIEAKLPQDVTEKLKALNTNLTIDSRLTRSRNYKGL